MAPPSLTALLDFLKSASLHPSCRPGFARVLQVSHSYLSPDNVSIINTKSSNKNDGSDDNSSSGKKNSTRPRTIVRYYRGTQQEHHHHHQDQDDESSSPPPPLFSSMGLWWAIMDEMTTNATFLYGCPTPPGASIHMRLELLLSSPTTTKNTTQRRNVATSDNNSSKKILNNNLTLYPTSAGFIMDSSVIKSGKTMSFTECKIYHQATTSTDQNNNNNNNDDNLIAIGSQVKYLPTGSWVMDALFTTPLLWNMFVQAYVRRTDPPLVGIDPAIGIVQDYLQPTSQTTDRATFAMTPYLTNPFGALHGGAQGMMMEIVGQSLAKSLLQTDHVQLVSMQVDFVSSGRGPGEVEVTAHAIQYDIDPVRLSSSSSAQLVVQINDCTTGRIVSTGNLRFIGVSVQ